MGERRLCKPEVAGSSPAFSIKQKTKMGIGFGQIEGVKVTKVHGGCLGRGRR